MSVSREPTPALVVAEPALGAEPLKADEEQPQRGQHRMKCTADLLDAVMLTDIPVQTGPCFLHRFSRLQRQSVQPLLLILIQLCVCLCTSGAYLPASMLYTHRSQGRSGRRLFLVL